MPDYVELAGREKISEQTRTIYRTRGVATTAADANAPERGDTLAGTSHTVGPICMSVKLDEVRYPKRYLFLAVWEAPLLRSEL